MIALTHIETGEPGGLIVELPDKVPAVRWVALNSPVGDQHAAGYPTGLPDAGIACRCGQADKHRLRLRLGRLKVLCIDCSSRPLPVAEGDPVAFRLSASDLAQYVRHASDRHIDAVVLRGQVEGVCEGQELLVRVDGWPMTHSVAFADLVERPGTRADMDEFWPDTDPAILDQAFAQMREAGTFSIVSRLRDDEEDD